jgi:HEAT repeat protein
MLVLAVLLSAAAPGEIEQLVAVLRVGTDAEASRAMERLRFIGAEESAGPVAALLEDPKALVRMRAAQALALFPHRSVAAQLVAALDDASWPVRRFCARALGAIRARIAGRKLALLLRDPQPEVRREAATALGNIGDAAQLDALGKAAKDADLEARIAAIQALGRLYDKRATAVLRPLLDGPSLTVRTAAAQALATLGDPGARQSLLKMAKAPTAEERLRAVAALAETPATWAADALASRLDDEDVEVRAQAALALGRRGDGRGVEKLVLLERDAEGAALQRYRSALAQLGVDDAQRRSILKRTGRRYADMAPAEIEQHLRAVAQMRSAAERLIAASEPFLGTPYADSPLGEGEGEDADPRIRLDAADCVTFIEQALAFSAAGSLDEARRVLDDIRYADLPADFKNRNHFIEAQWIPNNVLKGYIRDLARRAFAAAATDAPKSFGPEMWRDRAVLKGMALDEASIPRGTFKLPMLPLAEFPAALARVPNGALLFVVRKDFRTQPTRITHAGIVVVKDGKRFLRHAGRAGYRRVADEELSAFIARHAGYKRWPVEGFAIYEPLDARARAAALAVETVRP